MLTPLLSLVLTACGSDSPGVSPSVTVSPTALEVSAGGPPHTFTATVTGTSSEVQWTLSPASGAGSFSPASGPTTVYTPPASVSAPATVTLTATLAGSAAAASASITLSPAAATTGSLALSITGAPIGLEATVVVNGPNGYSRTLAASQTLSALPAGDYVLTPAPLTQPGTFTDALFGAAAATVQVQAGATTPAVIQYAQRPGSGKLWVPFSTSIGGYDESQLASGTAQPPTAAFAGGDIGGLQALAFDAAGNLWASDYSFCHLFRYGAAQLGQRGTLAPDVTVGSGRTCTPGKLGGPDGLAFDPQGDLWVADYNNAQLVKFTPAQLNASGDPSPVVLSGAALKNPQMLAFDAGGNLWVSNLGFRNVLMFSPAQLAAGGAPAPARTLSSAALTAPSGGGDPAGMAFDGAGNLWVSNYTARTLLRFSAASLGSAGSQNPDRIVTPVVTAGAGGNGPGGLALDKGGNLWVTYTSNVADLTDYRVVRIRASDLTDGSRPTPAAELTGYSYIRFGTPAFFPAPPALLAGHRALTKMK